MTDTSIINRRGISRTWETTAICGAVCLNEETSPELRAENDAFIMGIIIKAMTEKGARRNRIAVELIDCINAAKDPHHKLLDEEGREQSVQWNTYSQHICDLVRLLHFAIREQAELELAIDNAKSRKKRGATAEERQQDQKIIDRIRNELEWAQKNALTSPRYGISGCNGIPRAKPESQS